MTRQPSARTGRTRTPAAGSLLHGQLLATTLDTPDGPFTVVEDMDGVVHASGWEADPARVLARTRSASTVAVRRCDLRSGTRGPGGPGAVHLSAAVCAVLAAYEGDAAALGTVPVHLEGTAFQREVWQALRTIPAGSTRTYAELAALAGRPRAVRAAAAACGRNAIALFVPCHRVVAGNGALAGFAWGVEVKRALLEREGPRAPRQARDMTTEASSV